jgi:hypothetical protein
MLTINYTGWALTSSLAGSVRRSSAAGFFLPGCWRLRRLYAYLAVLGRCGERIGSRTCAVAVDDDKTVESVHFGLRDTV